MIPEREADGSTSENIAGNSPADPRDAAVSAAIEAFEASRQQERAAKPPRAIDLRATRREGVYMLVYAWCISFVMAGMHGYMREWAKNPQANIDRPLLDDLARNAMGVLHGYGSHIATHWWLDLTGLLIVSLIAFRVQDVKRRRRYFKWALAMIVVAYAALMFALLSDLFAGMLS